MNYNKVLLGGRLTRDPELRVTPKGTAICQFSVAASRKYKNDAGQESEEVMFADCEAWGKTGELVGKHFHKGKAIFVEGRLKLDQWEDKTTKEKRSKVKVVVDTIQFVGPKEEGGNAAPESERRGHGPTSTPPRRDPPPREDLDEDVPF